MKTHGLPQQTSDGCLHSDSAFNSFMDFTSDHNTENSDQTNASGSLFNVAGEPLA